MAEKNSMQESLADSKNVIDWFYCSQCDKTLPIIEETEHKDWHLAKDLQSQQSNQNGNVQVQVSQSISIGPVQTMYGNLQHFPPAQNDLQPPSYQTTSAMTYNGLSHHRNAVSEAAGIRALDEQQMQNMLQAVQVQYKIYNSEIEPEHGEDTDWCYCPIHNYKRAKMARWNVRRMWYEAVVYPGESRYSSGLNGQTIFNNNPYTGYNIVSPYGNSMGWAPQRPVPGYHERWLHQMMRLNQQLNVEAQRKIDAQEPKFNIWTESTVEDSMAKLNLDNKSGKLQSSEKHKQDTEESNSLPSRKEKTGKSSVFSGFKKSMGIKSSEQKKAEFAMNLRNDILYEETGRWPDAQMREVVRVYQDKIGITQKVALLRNQYPIQYAHLLRAGYFEPIPVAWANQNSNPLKFIIDPADSWPGITPAWRGYEDTAEERLYWVLNHRDNSTGSRLKPDFVSVMQMAMSRMASAVEPPPEYFSPNDVCHVQHTSEGYSRQVMPAPFVAHDRPESVSDDTMILLDVSGSMDFVPLRPVYDRYMVVDYFRTTQPKNKDVARAIVRRFTDAMINHDRLGSGYDLVTFSSQAGYVGTINHQNFDALWSGIGFGGLTRVMTGWQMVKERHFTKHAESATHHPIYGWLAGPKTPMLRLLLLLDGEASDMDEFELDLLGLSWAHVTIFLIGVDGCPHHHRHANELQRISDVNPHVAFVDAQGNMPERFVTHELLKRHLGYDISMREFETLEQPPPYVE